MNIEKPERRQFSYKQTIRGTPDDVFSLLCPVAEIKWVPDWRPEKIFTRSGKIEKHCMFLTENDGENALWIVSEHDPDSYYLEVYKVIHDQVVIRMEITLEPESERVTRALIIYEFTVVGYRGKKFLDEHSEEWFEGFMYRWEEALNHYLLTGRKIDS